VARHLTVCDRCANEIAALGGVRQQLAAWTTPEVDLGFAVVQQGPGRRQRGWARVPWAWRMPAWQPLPLAAAAVLVLGGALFLARLDIQYGAEGLRVRTGWGHAASPASGTSAAVSSRGTGASPVQAPLTAADLAAFEARFRRELATSVVATSVPADPGPAPRAIDDAWVKRVRQLIEESEIRQQQNLQLRVTELGRDFQMQRQADLVQIEQSFGRLAGDTAQQRQMLNQYLRNVSVVPRPQ
jgi:hypothetical protein